MNQKQKAPKQPQDPYAQRGKSLASSVQKLRGWVGSDPSRTPELADALVEVTEHRLLGHGYAVAAVDAQESVRRAAELLTVNGPIGPYTAAADAARYVAAVVHLATIQAAVGQPAASGVTLASLDGLHEQLREVGLEYAVAPSSAVWALCGTARSALASGDLAEANAHADAASARLAESGHSDEPDGSYLAIDVARLASDCRWAAGRAEDALAFLHLAQTRYEALVAGRLHEPGRLSPALLERLAEPPFGLYRDLADRLAASGEADLALVTRRALVALLRRLAPRLGDRVRVQLSSALADLARELAATDRFEEADAAAAEATTSVPDWSGSEPTQLVVCAARARVLTHTGRAGEAVALLRPLLPAAGAQPRSAADAVGLLALAEALRAAGELDDAVATEQTYREVAAEVVGPVPEGGRPVTAVLPLARGVVSRGPGTVTWSPLPPGGPYTPAPLDAAAAEARLTEERNATTAWLEAERADAHRRELDRLEQARLEAERQAAESSAAERAAAARRAAEEAQAQQAERLEVERRTAAEEAAEEAERLDRRRRREERLEAHRLEVEQREAERAAELAADGPTDPAEAERLELERLQQEIDELERAEAAAAAAPAPDPTPLPDPQTLSEPVEDPPSEPTPLSEPVEDPPSESTPLPEPVEDPAPLSEPVEDPAPLAEPSPLSELVEDPAPLAEPTPLSEPVEDPAPLTEPVEDDAPLPEPVEDPPSEPVEDQPDALALAQQAWQDARGRGDRRGARAANEQVVELLRLHAQADPARYGPPLREALDALATARLRSGDLRGSRAAAREARALTKNRDR